MRLYLKTGTEGGTRTHKPFRAADFKSAASAIPPPRLGDAYRKVVGADALGATELGAIPGGDGRIRTAE